MVSREARVEWVSEALVAMRPEAVRQTRIPPDAAPAPLPRKFAPNPDCCFPAINAPAPGIALAHRTRPDRLETRSPHGSTNAPCGSARAVSPPTGTDQPSACPNHDSIPAPGNPRPASALSPAPAYIPGP